jgi:glycerol uptake facilitator-like aquaporin
MRTDLLRRAMAELLGTALLLVAVVGSGIMAQQLSPGQTDLQLLENSIATGLALAVLILVFAPLSGAHFNPAVTLAERVLNRFPWSDCAVYWVVQVLGGFLGVVVANLMFSRAPIEISNKARWGWGLWLGEVIATFGLLLVIFALARSKRSAAIPFAVGAYIAGAYWFTSSTSFANPAVTIARMFSDTFAGIAPSAVIPFLVAQFIGASAALVALRYLSPLAVNDQDLKEDIRRDTH